MPSSEFDLIARYFAGHDRRGDVVLGVGDDAALIASAPPGEVLAVTIDTLVSGVHFHPRVDISAVGIPALVDGENVLAVGESLR